MSVVTAVLKKYRALTVINKIKNVPKKWNTQIRISCFSLFYAIYLFLRAQNVVKNITISI